jgi:hypothetical protein
MAKLTPFQHLERRYMRARRARDKLTTRQAALQAEFDAIAHEIRPICAHPLEHRLDITWTHDNGYGRQSKVTGERCQLCRQYRAWKDVSQWSENYPSSRFRDD